MCREVTAMERSNILSNYTVRILKSGCYKEVVLNIFNCHIGAVVER